MKNVKKVEDEALNSSSDFGELRQNIVDAADDITIQARKWKKKAMSVEYGKELKKLLNKERCKMEAEA